MGVAFEHVQCNTRYPCVETYGRTWGLQSRLVSDQNCQVPPDESAKFAHTLTSKGSRKYNPRLEYGREVHRIDQMGVLFELPPFLVILDPPPVEDELSLSCC